MTTDRRASEQRSGEGRLRNRWRRMTAAVQRAFNHPGAERDALLTIVKSVLAATAAWLIANDALGAPSATFAPFTALLMVQATISQSLDQAVRYAAAMVFGVVLTGVVIPSVGAAAWTFAGLILIALVFGRWRKLGQQGPQVGVAALFAYSTFSQSGGSTTSYLQLASIAGLVVLGCALGVLTNLVIVPPMRYRSAEYGINALARSLHDLLTDLSEGLRDGVPDRDQAEAWQHRADQLPNTVSQARATVEHAAETMRFNPRRLFLRGSSSFAGHRTIVNALEHASEQLRSATQVLTHAANTDGAQNQAQHHEFLASYAEVLAATAEAARALGELHSVEDAERLADIDEATTRASQAYSDLAERITGRELDDPDQWPVYGPLQTDAHRLVEEFVQARHTLEQLVDQSLRETHAEPERSGHT